jgi:hypothetical protein
VTTKARALASWAAAGLVLAACRHGTVEGRDAAAEATMAARSASPAASDAPPRMPAVGIAAPVASVLAVINPAGLPAYGGPVGSVVGRVLVTGPPAPAASNTNFARCPNATHTRGKLFREGPPEADGARPLGDALVGVTGYAGFYVPETRDTERLALDRCDEAPRTIAITFGQRLEIVNRLNTLVAPYLIELPAANVLVARNGGDPVSILPSRLGHFTFSDRMGGSDYLGADLYVLPWPLHAVTDASGHFRIDGVPVGSMTVSARLAAIGRESSATVDVRAGASSEVTLRIAYDPAAREAAPRDAAARTGARARSPDAGRNDEPVH